MKRLLLCVTLLVIFGAGCSSRTEQETPTDRRPAWLIPREGLAIITDATLESGPTVSVTDAATGRKLTTQLPSIFTDGQGVYTTQNAGERISVQLGVGGSVEEDEILFGQQTGLDRFERMTLGDWKITVAHQANANLWVVRGTQKDALQKDGMYHVIECVSTEKTNNLFWDGCRTMIERARIDQSRASP